jgi:hypothetical protein
MSICKSLNQCCGSGSVIRCFFDPWVRDPDPGKGKNQDYFSVSLKIVFRFQDYKYLNSLTLDPECKKIRIRDKHPDPQH